MRITFVLPYADLSGGVRVVAIHARKLQEKGHHVEVISFPRKRPPLKARVKHFLKHLRPYPFLSQGPTHLESMEVPWTIMERPGPLKDEDLPEADVLVLTWWETVEWTRGLSLSRGVPCHFVQAYEIFGGPKEKVDEVLSLPTFKITVSKWLEELLEKRFSPPGLALVPNSVDLERFRVPPRGKQELPTAGVMYSTTPNKGCDLAFAAFEEARRRDPRLRLVSFGHPESPREPPLPEGATYFSEPAQEEIPGIYASCDVWIFPGRNEGFGLPILEAMACRTPVVATPAGAAPEILQDGRGVLVPQDDPKAMAEGILRVTSMEEEAWKELSRKAREFTENYTWDDASRLFERALEEALELASSSRRESGSPPGTP